MEKYEKVSKKSKKYVVSFILLVTIGILLLLGLLNVFFHKYVEIIYYFASLDIILMLICLIFLPNIIYENYGYDLDEDKLESKYGIFFINKKIVLLDNVYKMMIKKSPLGRVFGLYSLTLATSAGNVKISFLDDQKIDELFYKILNRRDKIYVQRTF